MRYCIIMAITFFFFNCSSKSTESTHHNSQSGKEDNYLKIKGDSVEIPTFEVEVVLSDSTNEYLSKNNESVIVNARLSGKPNEEAYKQYDIIMDEFYLLNYPIELAKNKRLAKFEGVKFHKKFYDYLADKNIDIAISVISGRKSTDINLLSCDHIFTKINKLAGKKIIVKGKLTEHWKPIK
jgi:hypothetical protein